MKKFWDWLMTALPVAWGCLWVLIITFGSVALLVIIIEWLLGMIGVN